MVNKGRLLGLLYIFPPKQGTAAIRNYNQFEQLTRNFEQNYLITNAEAENNVPNSKFIHVKSFDYRILSNNNGSGHSEKNKNNVFSQFVIKLINTFPFNIIIGEGGGYYILKSYFVAKKLINSNNITHLYSSYRPFADHFTAYFLKKKYPGLTWIADFRDLIVDPHYDQQFFPKWHQRIYKKLFRRADVLTTISEGLADKLKIYGKSVITLENGIDDGYIIPESCKTAKFTLAYTGAMFLDERNGAPIFAAIRDLIDSGKIELNLIEVIYAGKDADIWKNYANDFNLNSILTCTGQIVQQEAEKIQNSACINVLLSISSNQLAGVTTGKFIEYLKAGSPILAIIKGQNDEIIQQKLSELNIGKSYSDQISDQAGISQFIAKEYSLWSVARMNRKPLNTDIFEKKYNRNNIIKPLLEII